MNFFNELKSLDLWTLEIIYCDHLILHICIGKKQNKLLIQAKVRGLAQIRLMAEEGLEP